LLVSRANKGRYDLDLQVQQLDDWKKSKKDENTATKVGKKLRSWEEKVQ
jgi:hypothetical protein